MTIIQLHGCTPTPLASYLKGLGVFRILSQQRPDTEPRAFWKDNCLHLSSTLDATALKDFFLKDYSPSPLVSPWNGASGFYPKNNTTAIRAIESSTAPRLTLYRNTIAEAREAIEALNLTEKPEKDTKEKLLLRCRNTFSDAALDWLDSAYVLTEEGAKYPPLLGTGGNDGRLEFTNNFMQRVTEVLDITSPNAAATAQSTAFLDHALFSTPVKGLAVDKPIGQFNPSSSGGANASTGFDAKSIINPWDFILALEGTILFASAVLKRLEGTAPGQLAYPFCVQPSGSGYGSSSKSDENDSRCEIWMPLWSSPASLSEIKTLFSEGRAWVGRRPAKNGVDFSRAIASLGVDRGISEFQRYGFHVRNGLAYFATPLQRFRVRRNSVIADLLSDCDGWIQVFLGKARSDNAPGSIQRAARNLEAAIIAQCASAQNNNPAITQELLMVLGECEQAIASASKWTEENFIRPIPPLTSQWVSSADTGSTEYRLAASLASLRLWVGQSYLPVRSHLESVKVGPGSPPWASWSDSSTPEVVSSNTDASSLLIGIMRRRVLLAQKTSPASWPEFSKISVWPSDIADFIEGRIDEPLFIRLLWGLCLIDFSRESSPNIRLHKPSASAIPSALFAQLKLCFASRLPENKEIPVTPEIFNLAASGDGTRASQHALRRLHGSSIPILHIPINLSGETVRRTAAALLFPLWDTQLKETCEIIAPEFFETYNQPK
jgi:CRISPR-associated protein Csx17